MVFGTVGIIETPYGRNPYIVLYEGPLDNQIVFFPLRVHDRDFPDLDPNSYFGGNVGIEIPGNRESRYIKDRWCESAPLPNSRVQALEMARKFASHLKDITDGATNFEPILGPLRKIAKPFDPTGDERGWVYDEKGFRRPTTPREQWNIDLGSLHGYIKGRCIPTQAVAWLENTLPNALSRGGLLHTKIIYTDERAIIIEHGATQVSSGELYLSVLEYPGPIVLHSIYGRGSWGRYLK